MEGEDICGCSLQMDVNEHENVLPLTVAVLKQGFAG